MNDDTIYRQAAIAYAISGLTREFDGEKWIRVSEVRESLKTMPSAEHQGQWIPVNDDIIYRQAAIDALKQFKPEIIPYKKARSYVEETIDTMYDRIEELPSVQPVATDTNVGDTTHKNVIYSPVQMAMDYAVNAMDFSASSDTISRQAAIDALDGELTITGRENAKTIRDYINGVNKKLRELPSAERRGRWIDGKRMRFDGTFHWFRQCSECLYEREDDTPEKDTNYCPDCGAKMQKE